MQVREADARGLMKALKANQAAKGSLKQLKTKLNELPRWAGQVEEPEDEGMLALFRKLCRAAQDGDEITVTADGGEDEPATSNGHSKAPAPKAAKQPKAPKAAKQPKAPKEQKPKAEPKGPGVIDTIEECLKKASVNAPVDKAAIVAELVKRFPDRSEESMAKTVQAQVPGRIAKERGLDVRKGGGGYWVPKKAGK